MVATEDFLLEFSFLYNHQSWHKTIVSRTSFTYIITKQPLVGVTLLILQIMEQKLREVK